MSFKTKAKGVLAASLAGMLMFSMAACGTEEASEAAVKYLTKEDITVNEEISNSALTATRLTSTVRMRRSSQLRRVRLQ